jgi:phosphoglycerol transferase MdoB-like AlkP superfamily enzyme
MVKLTAQAPDTPWPLRLLERLTALANLSLALLLALLTGRALELSGILLTTQVPPEVGKVLAVALRSDLLLFFELLVVLLPLFLAGRMIFRGRSADVLVWGVLCSPVLICADALSGYFLISRVPLGSDLFGYSLGDILTTARAGYHFSTLSVASLLVPLAVFWVALPLLDRHPVLKARAALLVLGVAVALTVCVAPLAPRSALPSEFAYDVAANKAAFFIADSIARFRPSFALKVRPADAVAQFRYLDPQYPFLRGEDTRDVLGEYFAVEPGAPPPNIVFLSVEGLGRAFSGPDAYLGSFTPFLDELARKSLYFENFLASQGRTFASLPSILGSLPFADQGFNSFGRSAPKHLTLLSILKRNGYRTRFFCGTRLDFDNQGDFLALQNIDLMVGIQDYDATYYRLPGSDWGYADKEILRKALETDRGDPGQPYVDYVQTISTHPLYAVPGQEEYLRLFEERMRELHFSEAEKASHRQYREIYSTILYADSALRSYFEEQAKLPGYGNTIYFITGDHRLAEIPPSTRIDRYHVPLIIFSPLLKRSARIQSISSHLDIAPTLLAFLRNRYGIRTPDEVTWVGSGLDMEPSLRNIHRYPIKRAINSLDQYVSGRFFLDGDSLFAIGADLDLEPARDEAARARLQAEFADYRIRNDLLQRNRALIPDSLYAAYFP